MASTGTTIRLIPKPIAPWTIPPSRTIEHRHDQLPPAGAERHSGSRGRGAGWGGIGPDPGTAPVESAVVTRRFYVRTFGCQMNEHDSERIAGLLAADGMEATDDVESADVVVLNTCCIRENADNKLYGHLGHLQSEGVAAPTCRSRSAVVWPRRTVTSSSSGPGTSTSSSVRTTSRTCRRCLRSRRGPARRSSRSSRSTRRTRRRSGGARGRSTARGSRFRSGATTRARSASCRRCAARGRGQPSHGRRRPRGRRARPR